MPGSEFSLLPPRQTQAADQSARVAQTRRPADKAREDLQEGAQEIRFYSSRSEHGYLGWQLTPPVSLAVQPAVARSRNARHTVVVFGDIENDTSWKFHFWFTQLIEPKVTTRQSAAFAWCTKHWPMDPDSNP
jgi:hypothetical protein